MKQVLLSCGLAMTMVGGAAQARAQDQAPEAPAKFLQIVREEIKAGRATAHEKFESGYARAFKAAKRAPYLGMSSLTGPSEAWFVIPFPSLAAYEQENEAVAKDTALSTELARLDEGDSAFRTGGRSILAQYNPDASYQARGDISGVRYIDVAVVRVRAGHGREFEEINQIRKKAHEQASVDEHFAVYEVKSGMPAGTYVVLTGHHSLAELDNDPHTKAYRDALGDEGRAKIQKLIGDAILSVDQMLFQLSPSMSSAPAWLTKGDPDFWMPRKAAPKAAAKPAAPKPTQ